ncbi:Ig 3 and/or I-set domain containing protein, partial [Asbolus verrucosus]
MEPSRPVKATDQTNVTLVCNVTDGNPTWLRKVLWLLDGEVMADLPECNYSQPAAANETLGGPFCGIDPSILSLIKVDHSFAGNYTCQGQNDAGRYGPVSRPRTLEVYCKSPIPLQTITLIPPIPDPPKMAKLRHYPSTVIKNGEVNLICEVEDPGQPDNVTYEWYRGSHLLRETQTSNLTIHKASLETRSNFTCVAKNAGGKSEPAYDNITVLAPPAFIGNLNSYKGVLYSAPNVSLTCRIECYPACSVIWFKDGHRLDTENNHLYYVNIKEHPADVNKNDFESIESTLVWDMKNWPDQMLNKSAPHSHYTCAGISKGTQRRPNVTFTTEVAIDFPPEDLQVSETVVHVDENKSPEAVKCSGKGRPKLSYVWKKNSTGELIGKDDTLQLGKMPKSAAGNYTCEAFNKYGNKTVNVYFDVKYEPECTIEVGDREGKQVLVCSARGNPPYISYKWRIHEYNDTVEYTNNNAFLQEGFSYLYLDTTVEIERTYECIANNSVGSGFCNKKIPAHQEQSSQTGEP